MGAEPWSYFVPYRDDLQTALETLQQREFEAGRYRCYSDDEPPSSIEEAREMADADGTASILDIERVDSTPYDVDGDEPGFGRVRPLPSEMLRDLYGTDRPTRAMIESNDEFFEAIERGTGIYIIAYEGDRPSEIYFAGYSYD